MSTVCSVVQLCVASRGKKTPMKVQPVQAVLCSKTMCRWHRLTCSQRSRRDGDAIRCRPQSIYSRRTVSCLVAALCSRVAAGEDIGISSWNDMIPSLISRLRRLGAEWAA